MRWAPTWATTLGDHRYDDQLAPRDAAAIAQAAGERDELLARLRAISVDAARRRGPRSRTRCCAAASRPSRRSTRASSTSGSSTAGGGSLFGELSYLVESHTVKTPDDAAEPGRAAAARATQLVDDTIANLAAGLARGARAVGREAAPRDRSARCRARKPVESWAMAQPAVGDPAGAGSLARRRARPPARGAARRRRDARSCPRSSGSATSCAIELLPQARTGNEGLAGLPDGEACYRAAILNHVGLRDDAGGAARSSGSPRSRAPIARSPRSASRCSAPPTSRRRSRRLRDGPGSSTSRPREEILAAAQTRARSREGGDRRGSSRCCRRPTA